MRLFGHLPANWQIPALAAVHLGLNVLSVQAPGVDEIVQDGGTVAIGVLLGLYVITYMVERLLPLFKNGKDKDKSPHYGTYGSGPLDTIRFRTDMVQGMVELRTMQRQVHELHAMHNVLGPNGAPVWYSNSQALDKLADILDRMELRQEELRLTICDVRDEVRRQRT